MAEQQYACRVDETGKATEMPLYRICGSKARNPHIRAFWFNTFAFFLLMLGWYALCPLGVYVATSMHVCENQLYPPADFPRRQAFLKFRNVDQRKFYCRYGANDAKDPTDCREVPAGIAAAPLCASPAAANLTTGGSAAAAAGAAEACTAAEQRQKYDPSVLPKCLCTPGTQCAGAIQDAGIAGVASTIFVRSFFGSLLERFGPINVQSGLLVYGAVWVAAGALISAPWNFTLIRFFIGGVGAAFVTSQFWSYLMFSGNIVGTASSTTAGWGNLGGGVAQFFMVRCLVEPFMLHGMDEDLAWRMAMLFPAGLYLLCAVCMRLLCWDTPHGRRFHASQLGKTGGSSVGDYLEVLRDPRALIMIFQYGTCFGAEVTMNNVLPAHFQTYFQMKTSDAALAASCMGLMNIFSRTSGGFTSDWLNRRCGFRGRLWAQFICLFMEAVFLYRFGRVSNEQPWWVALLSLLPFALFCQACCGTSYSIVPFVNRKQLAIVPALVAMGGNIGAVLAQWGLHKNITSDPLLPFQAHAAFVLLAALLTPFLYWPEYGSMFRRAAAAPKVEEDDSDSASDSKVDGADDSLSEGVSESEPGGPTCF